MIKNIAFFLVLSLCLFSCSENNENIDKSRGILVEEPENTGTYKKDDILKLIKTMGPQYADKFQFQNDVNLYKLKYYTINSKGEPVEASGLLVVPDQSVKSMPLLSYQHGTILNKEDVPSRKRGTYEVALFFGCMGYVVACPDYLGLGDSPGLHPYMHAKTEAIAVIDMLRASKKYCEEKKFNLSGQLFLTGYSQGAHATLATLKMMEEENQDEFSVTACAPIAGPYDVSGIQFEYLMRDSTFPSPGFLPYVIFSYNSVYQLYPSLSDVFKPDYYSSLTSYFKENTTTELSEVDKLWGTNKVPYTILNDEFKNQLKENENNSFRIAMRENDLYNWAPKTNVNLCHCDSDKHVPYANSVKTYNYFINNGAKKVQLTNPFPGGTHTTCAVPGLLTALTWFESIRNQK